MKPINTKQISQRLIALAASLLVSVSVSAQTRKTDSTSFQLGEKVVVIPAPSGFEEGASQFESIKNKFSATEAPGLDLLAVHLLNTDCERLRRGELGTFNFYTKISIRKTARNSDYSAAQFAAIPAEFQKNSPALFDINSDRIKAALERIEKTLNEPNVEMTQPVSLGEFDNRANVYGVMLMMTLKMGSGDSQRAVPLVASMSFVRVKERLIYVYAYHRYGSKSDVETLRDFARDWVTSILAAN